MPALPAAAASLGACEGTVAAFDDPRGLGTVITADGIIYPFHCANIADGTRSIEVGVPVSWLVIPGRLGRWEASAIRSVQSAPQE